MITIDDFKKMDFKINIPDEYKEDRRQIAGSTIREGMYSVILGGCTHWGYTNHFCNRQWVLAEHNKYLHRTELGQITYLWIPDYDKEHFIVKSELGYYVPTPARAIIDCIRYQDRDYGVTDEAILIGIDDYFDADEPEEALYEVADFFKLDRGVVDYLIKESAEYVPTIDGGGLY